MTDRLVYYPHRVLRAPALHDPIPEDLPRRLFAALPENGIGLAAPQIGITSRCAIAAIDPAEAEYDDRLVIGARRKLVALALVNPGTPSGDSEAIMADEGCLSFPDIFLRIERLRSVSTTTDRGLVIARGWSARVIQHEVDHLDGRLIIDHVSPELRDRAKRRMLGWHRAKSRAA